MHGHFCDEICSKSVCFHLLLLVVVVVVAAAAAAAAAVVVVVVVVVCVYVCVGISLWNDCMVMFAVK